MLLRFFTEIDDTLFLSIVDDAYLLVWNFYEFINDDIKLVMFTISELILSFLLVASTDLNVSLTSLISCLILFKV
jgi:hypothetical protein